MKKLKIKTPAKINLTLEVLNKREDGFHNIKSIMHTINLYDYLTFKVVPSDNITIKLEGNSKDIPYNEKNLVYKACEMFCKASEINADIDVYIEKNIPVEAGLAGGSTNAAGTFYALNKLFNNVLPEQKIDELCASLGSDLNFCLRGGCAVCSSRGEIIEQIPSVELPVSLIKPKNFGISAKEAYTKFSQMADKSVPDNTTKMESLIKEEKFDKCLLYNSLEKAVISDYYDLIFIKTHLPQSMMSGSGPTFFILDSKVDFNFDSNSFLVIENLKTIDSGVSCA